MSKTIEALSKSRPARRFSIVGGFALVVGAGATLSPQPLSPVNHSVPVHKAQERSKLEAPNLKSDSVGQMALTLANMHLGWGDTGNKNVDETGLRGALNLPNGDQVVTTIFTYNGASKIKAVKPNQVQIIDVDVYPAGKNYKNAPYQTEESYWFSPRPLQDGIGPLGRLYRYDVGVVYDKNPVWMDAYLNGTVDTFSYHKVAGIANEVAGLDHTYGNPVSANSVVRKIEQQALGIEAYAAADKNLPPINQIVHPDHVDKAITNVHEQQT